MSTDAIYDRHLAVFLLWACRETGVIEALHAGVSQPKAIAERTGITDRAANTVLEALADLGYAETTGGEYEPTERLRGFDPETPPLERGILPHRIDTLEQYMQLPEKMQADVDPEFSDEEFRNYMGGMAAVKEATVRAIVTTAEHAHPRPDRVLDVGGGPGRFGTEFARRGADVTLLDRPAVLDLLEEHHRQADYAVAEGDARESLPSGYDLAFSARMTVSLSLDGIYEYFENVFDALEPGGTFVAAEWVRGRSEPAERFGVHMLTISAVGNTYDEADYLSALEAAGFVDRDVHEVPGTRFQLLVGRRPE